VPLFLLSSCAAGLLRTPGGPNRCEFDRRKWLRRRLEMPASAARAAVLPVFRHPH